MPDQQRSNTRYLTAVVRGALLSLISLYIYSSAVRADSSEPSAANDTPTVIPTEVPSAQGDAPVGALDSPDNTVPKDITSVQVLDECLVADTCIDRFLWVLYQRAPKLDQIEVYENKEVTVKKQGRSVTVTQRIGTPADTDFGWKDPKAATKAGMALMDYVIGGMDRTFKSKLFYILYAAEQAGFSPGITSGFRDDYRQSIASGRKARSSMSYHGGSVHGGYGHGLAADVISIKGKDRSERLDSSRLLWNWIDQHSKQFGIGRPYLDYDPPHVAPTDGVEYAHHRGGGGRGRHMAGIRKHKSIAAHDRVPVRGSRTVRSAKV